MEHIVRTLGKDELAEYIENGYEEDDLEDIAEEGGREEAEEPRRVESRTSSRAQSRGADVSPDMETRLYNSPSTRNSKRLSNMSIIDVADRHLRDKTDAIAHIIRNISEQCAAAVEGLQLAHDADAEAEEMSSRQQRRLAALSRHSNVSNATASEDEQSAQSDTNDESLLRPNGRTSSIPPTPDLIHNRSSTSMSIASVTTTPERSSQQYQVHTDVPTKIVEDDDEERSDAEGPHGHGHGQAEPEMVTKAHHHIGHESLIHRPSGARISALGGH